MPDRAVRRAGIEWRSGRGWSWRTRRSLSHKRVRGGFGAGMTRAEVIAGMQQALLKRLPTLAELGNAAAFLASDRASAMTATLANSPAAPSSTSAR
jgi:hypothetical protein